MRDTTVAARYAKALFLITERRKETERARDDLDGLREVLKPGGRVARYLASPEVRIADKRKALGDALEGRALRIVILFLDLLLRKKRLGEFTAIADEFQKLVDEKQGVQHAHVVSAVPLLPAELEKLHAELEATTKHHIKLTTSVDPSLLGGALVRIGDHVMDRSVRTLLESIAHSLREVSV